MDNLDFDFSLIAEDCESSDGQSRYVVGEVKTQKETEKENVLNSKVL